LEIYGYIASVFIGITLGLLGGGGSILTIPILVYLFHLDAVTATAYSLFIVGSTSLIGVVPKQRKGLVNLRTGFIFGTPSLIAIYVTRRWIVPAIPDIMITFQSFVLTKRIFLLGLFAVLMIVTSFSMIGGRKELSAENKGINIPMVFIQGILIGLLTGLVGAGGGFLIIPALVLLTGLPMKIATGTSLFIIGFNSLFGFMGDIINLSIDWDFLFLITGLAVAGIFIGNWLTVKIQGRHLRKSFGWLTLAMGCWILVKELFLD
jgi:uncharacterized membrane protein YfcA